MIDSSASLAPGTFVVIVSAPARGVGVAQRLHDDGYMVTAWIGAGTPAVTLASLHDHVSGASSVLLLVDGTVGWVKWRDEPMLNEVAVT